MEELNICTLFIQTSLPPNHPTSLKVKNVHNFAIFQWICMKLFMETLNVSLIVLANLQSQRSFGDSDLMELVIFNHPPSRTQILFRFFCVTMELFFVIFLSFEEQRERIVLFRSLLSFFYNLHAFVMYRKIRTISKVKALQLSNCQKCF